MKKRKVISILMVCVMTISVFTLSACSKENEGNAGGGDDPYMGLTEEHYNELTATIEGYQKPPEFTPAGESFDMEAAMKGKTIVSIPMSSANEFTGGIARMFVNAAKEVGADARLYENQGEVSEWIQGLAYAEQVGADLVDLPGGSNPENMGAQIEELQKKGTFVQTTHFSGIEQTVKFVDGNCGAPYNEGGKILGDWAILKGGSDVNALIITADEVPSAESTVNGIEGEFKKYAPDAKRKYINVPVIEWSTKIQGEVQNAVQSDPDIDYVICIADPQTQYVVPALELTNMQDKVKVIGFNGTPFVIDLVREGKVEMTVGENLDWIGHASVDFAGRMLAGLPLPEDPQIPLYLWTKDNAEEAGVPAEFGAGYSDVYVEGYKKLWQMDK